MAWYPFSQRHKATEWAVEVGLETTGKGGVLNKIWKGGGMGWGSPYRGSLNNRGITTPLPTMITTGSRTHLCLFSILVMTFSVSKYTYILHMFLQQLLLSLCKKKSFLSRFHLLLWIKPVLCNVKVCDIGKIASKNVV